MNKQHRNSKPKSVLIVHHDQELVAALAIRCVAAELDVWTACSTLAAVKQMDDGFPDLLIAGSDVAVDEQLTFIEALDRDEEASQIPVIALCDSDPAEYQSRINSMCVYCVKCGNTHTELMPCLFTELINIDADQSRMFLEAISS